MNPLGKIQFLFRQGWTESCLQEHYWNPPASWKLGARIFILDDAYRMAEVEYEEAKKNVRLAQTKLPGGKLVERPWIPHERYVLFRKGYSAGAQGNAADPNCDGVASYDRGYKEGNEARNNALRTYAREVGHDPIQAILRKE